MPIRLHAVSPPPAVDVRRTIEGATVTVEITVDGVTVTVPVDERITVWDPDHRAYVSRPLFSPAVRPRDCRSCERMPCAGGLVVCARCDSMQRHPSWKDNRDEHSHDLDGT